MNGGIDRIIMVQCNELTNSGRKKKMENDFMLNEDKIKLMTGIALFEKREGKHIFPANRYFRSDYISGRIPAFFLCLYRMLHFMRAHVGALQHGASFKCYGT